MKILAIVSCLYLFSIYITPTISHFFQINNLIEPANKSYSSDEMSFLKTYYLMRQKTGYYESFKIARANLSTQDHLTSDVSTWRMPTIFWIWNLLAPSGQRILSLYLFLTSLGLISIFLLIKKEFGNIFGILSTLTLIPYIYDSLSYKTAFLFVEWWGLWFLIFGLTSFFYKRYFLSWIFLSLSVLIRELIILPVIVFGFVAFFRRENYKPYLFSIIIFSLVYVYHWFNVLNFTDIKNQTNFLSRIHGFTIINLQTMISFSMRRYLIDGIKSHYLVLMMGVLSLIINSLVIKSKISIYLLFYILISIVIFPMISFKDNDYWGILFVPLIIIGVPLLFNKLLINRLKLLK